MKFYIADAFTETLFGGNPAGIVCIPEGEEYPPDEVMRKTAAELRYSETAFVQKIKENEYRLRYFTPAAEVDLCGHATIASFYCLMKQGEIAKSGSCLAHTKAGDLGIDLKDDFVMMDMASPQYIGTIAAEEERKKLYEVMGSSIDAEGDLLPMMISTGLPDIMLPVDSRQALAALAPDMKRLSDLSAAYKVVGVHAFTVEASSDKEAVLHCRNFAPLYDIDEEAATGTSNGALTYYLYRNKKIGASATCRMIQGEAMGRPSLIRTSLQKNTIKVGGGAVILAQGTIHL